MPTGSGDAVSEFGLDGKLLDGGAVLPASATTGTGTARRTPGLAGGFHIGGSALATGGS